MQAEVIELIKRHGKNYRCSNVIDFLMYLQFQLKSVSFKA